MAAAKERTGSGGPLERLAEVAPQVQKVLSQAKPLLEKLEPIIRAAYPYCSELKKVCLKAYYVVQPYYDEEAGAIAFALVLLFYGGHFAYTIACWQVFRVSGHRLVSKSWQELCEGFEEAYRKLQEDSEAKTVFEHDTDGTIRPSELFVSLKEAALATNDEEKATARKRVMLLLKCIDPNKIWEGAIGLFTGLLTILATLRSRFVQCITIGANVGKKMVEIVMPIVQPNLHKAFPNHTKWVDFSLRAIGGITGSIVALVLVRVISAFNSALEGGNMLVQRLIAIAKRKGWLGTWEPSLEQSRALIMVLTVVGFLTQLKSGFRLPLLLRIPLTPVLTIEYILSLLASRPF